MHEKKDIWKTDGIGIGRGYGIVGLRTEWGNSGTSTADSKAETSASSGAETSSEKKTESIGRTDIITANSSDIRSMAPQVGVVHHLQR